MSADRGLAVFKEFETQLANKAETLAKVLPPSVKLDKFMEVVLTAVRANPTLLTRCDRRAFFRECVKAANDGLMPDGKEAAFVPRKGEDDDGNKFLDVTYQPMVYGIRKRARETDGLILDAQVVHENDAFEWEQGDDAFIRHKPLLPWKGKRGRMVAVFLIVRKFEPGKTEETILHREVMDAEQIAKVKSRSKRATKADHWTIFEEEGWKKSVVHRGMKSVPCSDALKAVLARDYDEFDFKDGGDASGPFGVVGQTIEGAALPMPPGLDDEPEDQPKQGEEPQEDQLADQEGFLKRVALAFKAAKNVLALNNAWAELEEIIEKRLSRENNARAVALYNEAEGRLKPAKKVAKR